MYIRSYGVEEDERFVPGAKMSVEDISGNINISCSLIGQKSFKLRILIYLSAKTEVEAYAYSWDWYVL